MRVVAATFAEEAAAEQALQSLRERYRLRPSDAEVAPLGTAGTSEGRRVVLAGRFHDAVVVDVERLIEDCGGIVVTEVDEEKVEQPSSVGARRESPAGGQASFPATR